MDRKNVAIILAGGSGTRVSEELPKQFMQLGNKVVLEYSIQAFQEHDDIHEIIIVAQDKHKELIKTIIQNGAYTKCKCTIPSGAERYQSTLSAIRQYSHDPKINLLIHDAARPLLTQRIITECVQGLKQYSAISVAIPSDDTIIKLDKNNNITDIPLRSELWCNQTPQCFHIDILQQSYQKALRDPSFQTTDDCRVVHQYHQDIPIYIVEGDRFNKKLTYKTDFTVLEALLPQYNRDKNQ